MVARSCQPFKSEGANRQVQKGDTKEPILLLNKNSTFAKSLVITSSKKHLKALKSELSSDVLNDIAAVIPF